MTIEQCKTCREFGSEFHECAPIYEVWNEEDDRMDSCEVYARSGREAVEKWAEQDDINSAEYYIVSGSDATVMVAAPGGKLAKFIVSGESVPEYHARFVEGVDDDD